MTSRMHELLLGHRYGTRACSEYQSSVDLMKQQYQQWMQKLYQN